MHLNSSCDRGCVLLVELLMEDEVKGRSPAMLLLDVESSVLCEEDGG